LSVDDDPLVAFNTTAMLADLGHEVYSASNGSEALDMVRREENIDLIITDQAMPGMTGTELAKAVRAERPTIPILIATGYAELPESEGRTYPSCRSHSFRRILQMRSQRSLRIAASVFLNGPTAGDRSE
jgi:CheY-like chemotaxis protein